MKANKALKRLTKIETLLLDVSERFAKGERHIQEALQDAKAAFTRVKAAVSSQASTKTAKNTAANRKKVAAKKAVAKTVGKSAATQVKKTARFSAARRKKQAERMKALWAAKRKAGGKARPTARRKPNKTVVPPLMTPAPVHMAVEAAGTSANIGEVERATGTD